MIGFADESLKKIMKTSLRGINSETRPYKPSVVGLPHLFTPGVSVLQKNQKKFEELFNFDQNGSCYQFSVRVYQGQDTSSMLIGELRINIVIFFSIKTFRRFGKFLRNCGSRKIQLQWQNLNTFRIRISDYLFLSLLRIQTCRYPVKEVTVLRV